MCSYNCRQKRIAHTAAQDNFVPILFPTLYVVPGYDEAVLTLLELELDLLALGRRLVLDPFLLNPGVASVFHNLLLYPGKEAWFQAFTRTLQAHILVDYPSTILYTPRY
jgi:hypothetical protein